MYTVRFTKRAQYDLQSTILYIATNLKNKHAASALLKQVNEKVKGLAENPTTNPLAKDAILAQKGIRTLLIKNYYMFYIIDDEQVSIIRFLYERRDWAQLL